MSHSGEPSKMSSVLEDVAEEAEPDIRSDEVSPWMPIIWISSRNEAGVGPFHCYFLAHFLLRNPILTDDL